MLKNVLFLVWMSRMVVSSRVNFVNLTDVGDPVDSARAYYEAGCDELVFWTSRRLQIIVKQRLTWCDALPIRSLSLSQLVVVSVRLKT